MRRYPSVGECTVPLRVLAVVCMMYNEALRKHCGFLWKWYGVLWSVTEYYGALRDVTGCYGTLEERYGALTVWNVTENIDFAHH